MSANRSPNNILYPDVLGQVTGGPRINMDALQVAMGIYPTMAFINQPIELVIVLQSMVDQEIQLKIAIRTPTADRSDNLTVVEVAKPQLAFPISAGEVGVLRIPMITRPPTKPGKDLPVRVAIRYRVAEHASFIRPIGGGAPPTVLSVSPIKLQVLKEIEFVPHKWDESNDILTATFSVAPKTLPDDPGNLKSRYEVLWAREGLKQEISMAEAQFDEALEIAKPGATGDLYPAFVDAVEARFAARGMRLHPGEAMAIAKIMTYTVEDAPGREPDVVLEETLWFRSLCHVLAANPEMGQRMRSEIISTQVFDAVLYESVLVAFKVLHGRVNEDLGDENEQATYASRFMQWFMGYGDADLSYLYLPLILGGIAIARLVRSPFGENAWDVADRLDEALSERVNLMHGQNVVVFEMVDHLLENYKAMLIARRIPRPEEAPPPPPTLPIKKTGTENGNENTEGGDNKPSGIRRLNKGTL